MTRPQQPASASTARAPSRSPSTASPSTGYEGDTIASALFAAGRRTFSRSFKYHRPRGEMCALRPVRELARRRRRRARACAPAASRRATGWPSRTRTRGRRSASTSCARPTSRRPVHAARLLLQDLHPPAASCGRSTRRSCATPPASGVLRKQQDDREWRTEYRRRHCDVLVIGGGHRRPRRRARAPRSWARTSCSATRTSSPAARCSHEGGHERARALAEQARVAGVEILTARPRARLLRRPRPGLAGRHAAPGPRRAAPSSATGVDRAAARLRRQRPARHHARRRRAPAGRALRRAPGQRRGRRDHRRPRPRRRARAARGGRRDRAPSPTCAPAPGGPDAARLQELGVELHAGRDGRRARRAARRSPARVAQVDARARPAGTERELDCDLLVRLGRHGPRDLAAAPGRREGALRRGDRALHGRRAPRGVFAAGAVAGHEDADAAELSGAIAGAEAAQALARGATAPRAPRLDDERERLAALPAPSPVAAPPAYAQDDKKGGKAFVDLDEDVTVKDIKLSIAEGYDSIELSKRYTTVTMGPSQGRFSQLPVDPRDGPGDGDVDGRRRHHDRAPAVDAGPDGRARRPSDRARQALGHPRPPPRARRARHSGPATGAAPTTTATRRARPSRCRRRPG